MIGITAGRPFEGTQNPNESVRTGFMVGTGALFCDLVDGDVLQRA
jgi:hypothetical protein